MTTRLEQITEKRLFNDFYRQRERDRAYMEELNAQIAQAKRYGDGPEHGNHKKQSERPA